MSKLRALEYIKIVLDFSNGLRAYSFHSFKTSGSGHFSIHFHYTNYFNRLEMKPTFYKNKEKM